MSEIDWSDFRLFHALAESGSVRGTAQKLGISHSTLSRRLNGLEGRMGVKLFERSRRGFKLTEAGGELLSSTRAAAESFHEGQRKISGLDQRMAGSIRVSMPDILAFYVLMPALKAFQEMYREIELEIDISYASSDLVRRQADVAIRMLNIAESPPEQLVGRKVATSYACAYATRAYLAANDPTVENSTAVWIGWEGDNAWVAKTPYPHIGVRGCFNHAELQHHAAASGFGIAYIPCALAHGDERLVRLPAIDPKPARDIWVLSHEDLRDSRRVKAFRDFVSKALMSSKRVLMGEYDRLSE